MSLARKGRRKVGGSEVACHCVSRTARLIVRVSILEWMVVVSSGRMWMWMGMCFSTLRLVLTLSLKKTRKISELFESCRRKTSKSCIIAINQRRQDGKSMMWVTSLVIDC